MAADLVPLSVDTGPASLTMAPVMPKAPKNEGTVAPAVGGVPFEEALKKLEGIVEEMEADDLPLDKLLAQFEEGTRLAKMCQDKLAEAIADGIRGYFMKNPALARAGMCLLSVWAAQWLAMWTSQS